MRSRREFIQLASISAMLLATKPWNSIAAKQKLKIENLLEAGTDPCHLLWKGLPVKNNNISNGILARIAYENANCARDRPHANSTSLRTDVYVCSGLT